MMTRPPNGNDSGNMHDGMPGEHESKILPFPAPEERSVGPLPPRTQAPPTDEALPRRRRRRHRARSFVVVPQEKKNSRAWPPAMRIALGVMLAGILIVAALVGVRHVTDILEQRRIQAQEERERANHPLHYRDIIEAQAEKNGIDPALVCAIILCESSFDAQAESYLGARGLMQTMESTAEWLSGKFDIENYSFDMMFDPETNVSFGTWYLGYLSRRYNGNVINAVCAYHAGQGNVDAWLANTKYSDDGVTLRVIPTDDTARYAKRVLNSYEIYQKYYYPPEDAGEEPFGTAAVGGA